MRRTHTGLTSIPGWFFPQDQLLFRWLLREQDRCGIHGDLAELGVYMGKSAVVMGEYVRLGETFTVIDLFESSAPENSNQLENNEAYSDLTQRAFESNYRRFHNHLPTIVRGPSSNILHHAAAGTHRFVHVDASHLYAYVQIDVASAQALLHEHGIVVFDDIQSGHAPGVAAAVWAAVSGNGLRPIAISQAKLYGTWGDPEPWQESLRAWLPSSGLGHEVQQIAGGPVVRIWQPRRSDITRSAWGKVPSGVRSRLARYRENRRQARL
jgi:predicted O-methyltransferase YrrM